MSGAGLGTVMTGAGLGTVMAGAGLGTVMADVFGWGLWGASVVCALRSVQWGVM